MWHRGISLAFFSFDNKNQWLLDSLFFGEETEVLGCILLVTQSFMAIYELLNHRKFPAIVANVFFSPTRQKHILYLFTKSYKTRASDKTSDDLHLPLMFERNEQSTPAGIVF